MKSILRYAGLLVLGGLIWGVGNLQAETLPDAVHHMLQTNPEIRAVSFNRLARDEEVKQARADYWPTLDISYSTGLVDRIHPDFDAGGNPILDTHPESTVLSLRQNLFRGFATKNEVRRQKSRVNSKAYELQGTSETIALNTSRVYLNVLRQMEILELAKENVTIHQRIFDQVKLRSESGLDSTADLDQVMGRLALADSDVVVTKANVADAKTDYLFFVGHMPADLMAPYSVDSVMPVSLDEAQGLAIENYPILKSAQADVDARVAQNIVAKGNYYPKLDVAVDQKWQEDVEYDGYEEEFSASAVVRFNIFNGWWDKARVAETKKLICEAKEIRNNTERQIVESIRLSWVAYQSTLDQIRFLENYVESTGNTAEAFSKQFNIGRRTMFDVLDIEAELINAKIDLVNAKYDKLYAQYRILAGIGRLVHSFGLQWPVEAQID
ncbi:MAG: TolC family outer membrane protein [Deltaproteobacteria bacterium]|jgi:adhesin transport system outer membrane protein|nr:TolC family outer membrane protein [Deltaproteobacteria bacterium]